MSLTLAERETIILFNEAEPTASIYTYNERIRARIEEYARHSPGKVIRSVTDKTGALHFELPKSDLRILFKRPRTEKQMQVTRDIAAKGRERFGKPPSPMGFGE